MLPLDTPTQPIAKTIQAVTAPAAAVSKVCFVIVNTLGGMCYPIY